MTSYTAYSSNGTTLYSSNGSSGGTTTPPALQAGDTLSVLNGAVVSNVTVVSGATEFVSSGGIISGSTINSGGTANYASGASGNAVTVASGGVLSFTSGDSITNLVNNGGSVTPSYVSAVSLHSGAATGNLNGGTTWTAVLSGGATVYQYVSGSISGTLAAGLAPELQNGDVLTVSSGAVASGVQSVSGGIMTINVLSGGELLSSTDNNGFLYVSSGGITSGNVLNSVAENISAGGRSIGDVYGNQYNQDLNTITVASGAGISGATVSSGIIVNVVSGASAANLTVMSGGTLDDNAGDVISGVTVDSGASLTNVAGATISGLTVNAGGAVTNNGGATLAGATVASGGVLYNYGSASGVVVDNGAAYFAPGLSTSALSGVTVQSGGAIGSVNGGVAWTAVASGGGTVYQYVSGGVSGTLPAGAVPNLQNGDTLFVSSGAVASGVKSVSGGIATVTVGGGGELLSSTINNSFLSGLTGAVISGDALNSVNAVFSSGASVIGDRFGNLSGPPNTAFVLSGATIAGDTITSQMTVNVASGANAANLTVQSGGVLTDNSGSVISGVIVGSGASFTNQGGATVSGLTVEAGGTAVNNPGAALTGATVLSGGVLSSFGSASGVAVQSGGAYFGTGLATSALSGVTVASGGAVGSLAGGVAWTAVASGGVTVYQYVSGGVSGTLAAGEVPDLQNGDNLTVSSGAVASGVKSVSGGIMTINVLSGGELLSSTENNGFLTVASGGTTSGNILNSDIDTLSAGARSLGDTFANQYNQDNNAVTAASGAIISGATVDSGATINVLSGATATNLTVNSGGTLGDNGGSVISGVTVDSGASFTNQAGATVSGLTVNAGGAASNNPGGTVSGTTVNSGGLFSNQGTATGVGVASGGAFLNNQVNVAPCFLGGTMIATPSGERAVETLAVGDLVTTLVDGEEVTKPVTWVGHRSVKPGDLPADDAHPIRIRADAFADGVPHRDLLVTAEHCILVDGGLTPVRLLVNGRSIIRDTSITNFTFYHVELERHGILVAEGLPTESYLDTGNRSSFANAEVSALRPSLASDPDHASWDDAAAPLTVAPDAVKRIWRRLEARARFLGLEIDTPEPKLIDDPDLRIVTGIGATICPRERTGDRYVFIVPTGHGGVRLRSRAVRPSDVLPYLDDRRRLGVMVGEISVGSGPHQTTLDMRLASGALEGWHEADAGGYRWTDGDAVLPIDLSAFDGDTVTVVVQVVHAGPYAVTTRKAA